MRGAAVAGTQGAGPGPREATGAPRVLHVLQSGDRGGVQRHVRDLACGLPEWTAGVASGTQGWLTRQLAAAGVATVQLPELRRSLHPGNSVAAGRSLGRVAAEGGATVLHAHGVIALLAALRAAGGRPVVYTPHGFQWRDPAHPVWVRAASLLVHRHAARRLAALVAVSRRDAADAAAVGVPPGRIHHVPNGVPPRAEGHRGRESNLVGIATRLVPGKGLPQLLRAVAAVPQARLLVAGDGPLRADLQAEARRLGVAERVEWMGWCDALDGFYDRIAVYATLSEKEGLPYAVLDALAAGLPAVASDIDGHRELVRHGETGWLVAAGDGRGAVEALRAAVEDGAGSRRRGERGRELAQAGFGLAGMLGAHRGLYPGLELTRGRGDGGAPAPSRSVTSAW